MASFATSYIPTVASQVTRAADSASMIGNNFARWYNVNEGTVYLSGAYSVQNGVTNANIGISGAGIFAFVSRDARFVVASTTVGFNFLGAADATYAFNLAGAYKNNNSATTLNGATPTVDTTAVPTVGTSFIITPNKNGGTIKRIAYYPRRLANTELSSITS